MFLYPFRGPKNEATVTWANIQKTIILPERDPLFSEGRLTQDPVPVPPGASTPATHGILVIGPSGKAKGVRAGDLDIKNPGDRTDSCVLRCVCQSLGTHH